MESLFNVKTQRRGGGNEITEVMEWYLAISKEMMSHHKLSKAKNRFSVRTLEGVQPRQHLDFGLWASRNERK